MDRVSTQRKKWNNPFERQWMQDVGAASTGYKQSHVILKALITGGVTGGIELFFAYPLEYLKTQLQFEEKSSVEKLTTHKTISGAAKHTFKKYGIRGFYRGIGVMLVGNVPKAGARFGTFETVRQYFGDAEGKMSAGAKVGGGVLAGVAESIIAVAPMETIKVKVIHDLNRETPRYKGSFHSIVTILKEEGFKGTYQGLFPTMLKQSSNQGSRFLLMESFKDHYQQGDATIVVPVHLMMIFGIFASFVTVYLNSPIDVVKTRMQGLERKRYKSSFDCMRQVFKQEGLRGFYKGSLTRGLRLCVDTMVSFTFFDHVMAYMSKLFP